MKQNIIRVCVALFFLFTGLGGFNNCWGRDGLSGTPTPIPHIGKVFISSFSVEANAPLRLQFPVKAVYDNPFDSEDIRIDAHISRIGGSLRFSVPAFYYQDYRAIINPSGPTFKAHGDAQWQVRLSFPQTGTYQIHLVIRDRYGETRTTPFQVQVHPAREKKYREGMIRVSERNQRYFQTDNGLNWFAVGFNACWGEFYDQKRGIFAYPEWFGKLAQAGGNYSRIWLSPNWAQCSLNTLQSGYDKIDLLNAWRMDYVLHQAEKHNIRLMLAIDSYNILRSAESGAYGIWEESPYGRMNGGPLDKPIEYFTNKQSLKAYKNRLRYIVARYGYSTSVFAWEFWNEVDLIDEFDAEIIKRWHRDMAIHLRRIDPWDHLITTSFSNPASESKIDSLPQLDFVQTHRYQYNNIVQNLGQDRDAKTKDRLRPHFHGEFNISVGDGYEVARQDPLGIHLHNAIFAAPGQMQAGTPMSWWWDSYIEPKKLYPIYSSFSSWIRNFDFASPSSKPLEHHWRLSPNQETMESYSIPPEEVPYYEEMPEYYEYGYEYEYEMPPLAPEVKALGIRQDSMALVWAYNANYTWQNVATGREFIRVENPELILEKMTPGKWAIQIMDPDEGKIIETLKLQTDANRVLTIPLPSFTWDLALRLYLVE